MYRWNLSINIKILKSNGTTQTSVISNQNKSGLELLFIWNVWCFQLTQICLLNHFLYHSSLLFFLLWCILKRTWEKRFLAPHVYIKTNLSMKVLFYCIGWCGLKLPAFKVCFAFICVFLNFQMCLSKEDVLFHDA